MHELPVQFRDNMGVIQHNLRNKRPGLQIPPPFYFKEIPFSANYRALIESFQQIV
jgi:hypothetical protein